MYDTICSGDSVTFTRFGGTPVTISPILGTSVWVTSFGGKAVTYTRFGGQSISVLNPSDLPDYVKQEAGLSAGPFAQFPGSWHDPGSSGGPFDWGYRRDPLGPGYAGGRTGTGPGSGVDPLGTRSRDQRYGTNAGRSSAHAEGNSGSSSLGGCLGILAILAGIWFCLLGKTFQELVDLVKSFF